MYKLPHKSVNELVELRDQIQEQVDKVDVYENLREICDGGAPPEVQLAAALHAALRTDLDDFVRIVKDRLKSELLEYGIDPDKE